MTTLTVNQLAKACQDHPYLLVRMWWGQQVGMNTKVAKLAIKDHGYTDEDLQGYSKIISYQPCDFMTYITYKIGFQ